jgi:hypothetical protein
LAPLFDAAKQAIINQQTKAEKPQIWVSVRGNPLKELSNTRPEQEVLMTKCFGCAYGLTTTTPTVVPSAASLNDILGVCWECHVLGCSQHAERDSTSGKWKCFSSVATATLTSAQSQAGAQPSTPQADQAFADSQDLESRFPQLARASEPVRLKYQRRRSNLMAALGDGARRYNEQAAHLLADALGIAEFIVYGTEELRPSYMTDAERSRAAEDVARAVLIRDLAEALLRYRNA